MVKNGSLGQLSVDPASFLAQWTGFPSAEKSLTPLSQCLTNPLQIFGECYKDTHSKNKRVGKYFKIQSRFLYGRMIISDQPLWCFTWPGAGRPSDWWVFLTWVGECCLLIRFLSKSLILVP